MNVPFLPIEQIRLYAEETLRLYRRARGKEDVFPLDGADLADRLFGIPVYYDDSGVVNREYGEGIVGCLFPDGRPSPWSRDRIAVVNMTPSPNFDPTTRNETFTILHEVEGHYLLHFLKGVTGERLQRSFFSREIGEATPRKPRLEWQADCAAGELMMPFGKVVWLLDRKQPPEMINLDLYEDRMMDTLWSQPGDCRDAAQVPEVQAHERPLSVGGLATARSRRHQGKATMGQAVTYTKRRMTERLRGRQRYLTLRPGTGPALESQHRLASPMR
jgi:hypothetical protein